VIGRHVVVAAAPRSRPAGEALRDGVCAARCPARERAEVRDGQHHAAVRLRHARHLGDRALGPIEVVERTLAEHRVEARVGEGQRIRPAPHPARLERGLLRAREPCPGAHAERRLGTHHAGATPAERERVLAEAARDVEDQPAGRRPRGVERDVGHALEQERAVARGPGRDHVRHVAIEVDDAHGAGR
jgi:hypothetical protein